MIKELTDESTNTCQYLFISHTKSTSWGELADFSSPEQLSWKLMLDQSMALRLMQQHDLQFDLPYNQK